MRRAQKGRRCWKMLTAVKIAGSVRIVGKVVVADAANTRPKVTQVKGQG